MAGKALRPLANLVMPAGTIEVVVRSGPGRGLRIQIDAQSEKYYWSGTYEPQVQAFLHHAVQPGDAFWDVGAHIGFLSAIASRQVGPTGCVIAFEPHEPNIKRLQWTVQANALGNVTILPLAVSDSEGSAPFYGNAVTSIGSLVASTEARPVEVRTTTLDNELISRQSPTLVKIDVEGGEGSVLRGARHMLAAVRPRLLIELLDDRRMAEAISLMPGYSLTRLDERNYVAEPGPVTNSVR